MTKQKIIVGSTLLREVKCERCGCFIVIRKKDFEYNNFFICKDCDNDAKLKEEI